MLISRRIRATMPPISLVLDCRIQRGIKRHEELRRPFVEQVTCWHAKRASVDEQRCKPSGDDGLRARRMSEKAPRRPSPLAAKDNVSGNDPLGLERLIFFSDAVFAIAITLLTLDIRLPAGMEMSSNAQLLDQLLGAWHKYLAYAIGFLAIGSFWMAHHRRFRFIKRYDRGLLMLNLLFLMIIAFVPFPTSVISESGNRTATVFYALTMTLAGLMLTVVWWYASRHNRLTDSQLGAPQRRRQFVALFLTVGLFFLSIGLAFLNNDLARFSWLLVVPISRYGQRV
jgi:uncharacterized membrane protein